MLSFFSDLNKIISWKPLIFENRKKDRYKCLQSRFWIFIHFSLPLLHIYTFLRMNKTWKNKKRTCFEKLIESSLKSSLKGSLSAFEKLIESLLKALEKPLSTPIVKKHAFLCVSNKLLYFCKRKELLDKQTYVYCRNRNRC